MEAHGVEAPALALPAPRAARLRAALLSRELPGVREAAIYAGLLALVAIAVFLSHVEHGGFVSDDWSNRTSYLYGSHHGVLGFVSAFLDRLPGSRPGLASYTVLTQQVFGLHMKLYLAFAVGVAWLLGVALYLLLRSFRLAPLHAGMVATLALLLPVADATRLWAGATFVELAVLLFLAGALLAVHSLRAPVFALGAILLWALSWSLHETAAGAIVAGLIVLAVVAYRRGPRPLAWLYGGTLVIGGVLLLALRPVQTPQSFGTDLSHVGTMARQSGTVLARSAVPFGTPVTALVLVVLAAIAVAGLFAAYSRHRRDVVPWLALAGLSLVLIALAYASYVPSDPHWYEPLSAGPSNRINALAGIGYVGVVYGLGGVAMTLAAGRRIALAAILPAVLALAVGAGYLHQTRRDAGRWNSAFAAEQRALTVVKRAVPDPAHGTAIYLFGHQATFPGGIPVFASTWDFEAAVQLTYRDRTMHGYPIVGGTQIVCGARTMYPNGNGYWPAYAAPYGSQVFVNVATGVSERATSQAACRDRGADFTAG